METQMCVKRCVLVFLSVLALVQATHAQDWHQIELENTGTIELPGKPIAFDTLGLRYYKVSNDTFPCFIILGMSVQGDETIKRSSKEQLMRRMEAFLKEQRGQQIQQSDITVDGRQGIEARYFVTSTNASNQSVLTNVRYLRMVDNDGRLIVLEMGMAADYEKEIEPIKEHFFNSLKLNEASVSAPLKTEAMTKEEDAREKIYTIVSVWGKIAAIVFLIIGAVLLVNRLKK